MSAVDWAFAAVGALVCIYIAARLVTAAYFKSREQHERKRHG